MEWMLPKGMFLYRNWLLVPAIFLSGLLLNGCYLLKQGAYILKYQVKEARDIEPLLQSGQLSPELEETFAQIGRIKSFAVQSLGLRPDRNYTRYVELERDYLVEVVSACAKDRFEPYRWRYPFFGSFPYKGFFERADALREAERLRARGLDVLVRRADAFSTLGFFVDPVYSFMSRYSVFALASLIIHEQTHATIFIKNRIQFNEELATFVGQEGALQFIREHYGEDSEVFKRAEDLLADWALFSSLMRGLYQELNTLYQSDRSRKQKLAERERIFTRFQTRFHAQYAARFRTEGFRSWGAAGEGKGEALTLNNAYLMSFIRYTQNLDIFYDLYEALGRDLGATIAVLKQAERQGGDPRAYLQRAAHE